MIRRLPIRSTAFGTEVAGVTFSELITPGGVFLPEVALGNNTVNRIGPIALSRFGVTSADVAEIELGGSGAIDNVTYEEIPTPAAAGAGFVLLGGLLFRRRHA